MMTLLLCCKRRATLDSSNECSRTEIGVSNVEGMAYAAALKYLTTVEASDPGERKAGDCLIGYDQLVGSTESIGKLLNAEI